MRVGNGGFSLRSRKLLEALQDPRIELVDAEDETICRTCRPLLERDHGIRFGSEALADRFSFEAAYPIGKQFGFHGLFNFCRTVAPDEIASLAPDFSDAIAQSPQLGALLRNCLALGFWPASAAIARRILAVEPGQPEAAQALATAEQALAAPPVVGRNEPCPCGSGRKYKQCHGAIDAPATTLAPALPPSADALAQTGVDAHQRGELDAAEANYRRALAIAPDHSLALHYLGVILYQRGQAEPALQLLRQTVDASPQEPEFHNNLGLALAALDRHAEAIAAHQQALSLAGDHVGAWNNLGLVLQAANRVSEAIAAFREAVARAPQFAQARWNLALALLLDGQCEEGWREYEWRLAIPAFQRSDRNYAQPRWDGVVRPGITVLLTTEQGLGDALHFIRFAEPLAALGVRVLVHAQASLKRLLATAPGVSGAFGPDDALPAFDAHLPLLSLPSVRGQRTEDRGQNGYLVADPLLRAKVVSRLDRGAGMVNIGLAWSGNPLHGNDRRRSIALRQLASLFDLRGVSWHSLQKGEAVREIADVPTASALAPLAQDNSFDDTAALIAELDLVITVDTSIAHLAGALGKRVWILLPFAPDWRWQLHRSDTPWYATARLFRQPRPGDWVSVVHDVEDALLLAMTRNRG
jgi:tetratricopeptide (TPR) repeat protein